MPVFELNEFPIFPPVEAARDDGLLALGGDLSVPRLLAAYRQGIFPWYGPGSPILWWSPNPRLVLFPEEFHVSKRLRRSIRNRGFALSFDQDFSEVMARCGRIERKGQNGTWIDQAMCEAYSELHRQGYAHSLACRLDGELVGGLYGVALGGVFFGESMFSEVSDASKVALAALVERLLSWGFELIDCQVTTPHLLRLGAREISREEFGQRLARALKKAGRPGSWRGGKTSCSFLRPLPS